MTGCRMNQKCHRAVTLLEIILATGLLVALAGMTFWFYASSLETHRRESAAAYRLRMVRTTLDRLTEEIRQASIITTNDRAGIRGEPERIWLSTIRLPSRETTERLQVRSDQPVLETDLVKIEYKIARHPDILTEEGYPQALGLARVEIRVPRANSAETGAAFEKDERRERIVDQEAIDDVLAQEEVFDDFEGGANQELEEIQWEELYAPEVRFLRFCYYDGKRWWDSWDVGGENALPQLVQVTIGFDSVAPYEEELSDPAIREYCTCMNEDPVNCLPEPGGRYTKLIRVPQADHLFRSRITRESQSIFEKLGETAP